MGAMPTGASMNDVTRKTEELIYDILKLAIVDILFRWVELVKLGSVAVVIVTLLVVYRHRQRLFHHRGA